MSMLREIRITIYSLTDSNLISLLKEKGVEFSWQFKGEIDENNCKVMEEFPLGSWSRCDDVCNNEIIFREFN